MIAELQSAIISRVKTGTNDFKTAITQGDVIKIFYDQAPNKIKINGIDTPLFGKYAVLSGVSNPLSFDSGSLYEECYFQIALYETNTNDISSSAGVHDLRAKCTDLFDFCSMIISGYELVSIIRLNVTPAMRTELGWVVVVNYKAVLQKDR